MKRANLIKVIYIASSVTAIAISGCGTSDSKSTRFTGSSTAAAVTTPYVPHFEPPMAWPPAEDIPPSTDHGTIITNAEPLTCQPNALESCNGVDDNCDGVIDEGCSSTQNSSYQIFNTAVASYIPSSTAMSIAGNTNINFNASVGASQIINAYDSVFALWRNSSANILQLAILDPATGSPRQAVKNLYFADKYRRIEEVKMVATLDSIAITFIETNYYDTQGRQDSPPRETNLMAMTVDSDGNTIMAARTLVTKGQYQGMFDLKIASSDSKLFVGYLEGQKYGTETFENGTFVASVFEMGSYSSKNLNAIRAIQSDSNSYKRLLDLYADSNGVEIVEAAIYGNITNYGTYWTRVNLRNESYSPELGLITGRDIETDSKLTGNFVPFKAAINAGGIYVFHENRELELSVYSWNRNHIDDVPVSRRNMSLSLNTPLSIDAFDLSRTSQDQVIVKAISNGRRYLASINTNGELRLRVEAALSCPASEDNFFSLSGFMGMTVNNGTWVTMHACYPEGPEAENQHNHYFASFQ